MGGAITSCDSALAQIAPWEPSLSTRTSKFGNQQQYTKRAMGLEPTTFTMGR